MTFDFVRSIMFLATSLLSQTKIYFFSPIFMNSTPRVELSLETQAVIREAKAMHGWLRLPTTELSPNSQRVLGIIGAVKGSDLSKEGVIKNVLSQLDKLRVAS